MSGKFLDAEPYEEPHCCSRPGSAEQFKLGTRWQCDCGRIYRVEPFKAVGGPKQHWTPREPSSSQRSDRNGLVVNGALRKVIINEPTEMSFEFMQAIVEGSLAEWFEHGS